MYAASAAGNAGGGTDAVTRPPIQVTRGNWHLPSDLVGFVIGYIF